MAGEPTAIAGLGPPIPQAGLDTVLRAWNGQGQLWEGLSAVAGELAERDWKARDIRRRANRVLLSLLIPFLRRWPTQDQAWIESLPAQNIHKRVRNATPISGTSWSETRKLGWPPRAFAGRSRERVADTLLLTSFRWTLDSLLLVVNDACAVEPSIDIDVRPNLGAAFALINTEPVASATGIMPSRADIQALRSEGRPWSSMATVADQLRLLTALSLADLAHRLVLPSAQLRWRLFHLGVLGEVLIALRECGCLVRSVRPLSGASGGPCFAVKDAIGRTWDLWFEAAGAWGWYGRPSPYVEVAGRVGLGARSIGCDLALVLPEVQALVLECKYSTDYGVVCRDGYEQVVTYAAEMRTRLVKGVVSAVVGPEEVVPMRSDAESFIDLIVGKVGIVPPSALGFLIRILLGSKVA